jgi:NDP-sugar pyrophosphorylase family protein
MHYTQLTNNAQQITITMRAMIFAAGLGTRFKPWTDHHPKALALVNGKSLLQRNIEYLQRYGIHEIVVNVHHFPDQIEAAVEKANGWGSRVFISNEREGVLETGGGLLKARALLENGAPFLIMNVDILTNLSITGLLDFFHREQPLIAFGVTDRVTARNFLFDHQMQLCGWRNKSTGEERIVRETVDLQERAYSCVAVFNPEVFAKIRQNGKFSLTETYLDLARDHRVLGYDHSGDVLIDVGKPGSVTDAESLFK